MPTTAKALLTQVLQRGLEPVLFQAGFETSPVRHPSSIVQYHRAGADYLHLVDVQKDKWWSKTNGQFTINLGWYFPRLEEIEGRTPSAAIPPGGCWTIHERLGMLATGTDKWWEIGPGTTLDSLAAELAETWQNVGKPWLEKHTPENLSQLRDGQHGAGICVLLGDQQGARSRVAEQLRARVGMPDQKLAWCMKHGLLDAEAAGRISEAWIWPTADFEEAIRRELG